MTVTMNPEKFGMYHDFKHCEAVDRQQLGLPEWSGTDMFWGVMLIDRISNHMIASTSGLGAAQR